jgi:hypothetical protein
MYKQNLSIAALHLIYLRRVVMALCLLTASMVNITTATAADFIEGDAALGSDDPRIPEPMLFDLVRPLGAKKGELEINTLGERSLESGPLNWAPEIEYAFADGYALEFELPHENSFSQSYKFALQGTFGVSADRRMIQGWQVITKKSRINGRYSTDALYLNGYRLSDKWSAMNMLGIRRTELSGDGEVITLINNSIFYDQSQRLTYGLEINSEVNQSGNVRYRIIPQIHFDLNGHSSIQIGGGFSRLNPQKIPEKIVAMRLIYSF